MPAVTVGGWRNTPIILSKCFFLYKLDIGAFFAFHCNRFLLCETASLLSELQRGVLVCDKASILERPGKDKKNQNNNGSRCLGQGRGGSTVYSNFRQESLAKASIKSTGSQRSGNNKLMGTFICGRHKEKKQQHDKQSLKHSIWRNTVT